MNRHIAFATLLVGGGLLAWWLGSDSTAALGQLACATGCGHAAIAWLRRDRKPSREPVEARTHVAMHQTSL